MCGRYVNARECKSRWNSAMAASIRYISRLSLVVVSMPCSPDPHAVVRVMANVLTNADDAGMRYPAQFVTVANHCDR
jgi:hypothetical protein